MAQSAARVQYNKPDCDSPTLQGYGGQASQLPGACNPSGGGLPFTGLDVLLIVLVAVVLVALGFLMRKLSR